MGFDRAMTHYPELPPGYYIRPRRRFPRLRGGFLFVVGAFVIGFLVSDDVRAKTREIAAKAATWATEVQAATEPPRQHEVAADDFTPTRGAFAGRSGANVRGYPLPFGHDPPPSGRAQPERGAPVPRFPCAQGESGPRGARRAALSG